MALIGDTVRLTAKFKKFDGTLDDPTDITLKVYDGNLQILSTINIESGNKVATGEYKYDYTIPDVKTNILFYEFSGTLEGSTIVGRDSISIKWI
jgi:hypothetical protein